MINKCLYFFNIFSVIVSFALLRTQCCSNHFHESHGNLSLISYFSLQPIQGPGVHAGRNLEEKCGGERGEDRLPRVTAKRVCQQEQGAAEAFDGGKI